MIIHIISFKVNICFTNFVQMARFSRLLTCREVTKGRKACKAFCLVRLQIRDYTFQKGEATTS